MSGVSRGVDIFIYEFIGLCTLIRDGHVNGSIEISFIPSTCPRPAPPRTLTKSSRTLTKSSWTSPPCRIVVANSVEEVAGGDVQHLASIVV